MRFLIVLFFLASCKTPAASRESLRTKDQITKAQSLMDQKKWNEAIQILDQAYRQPKNDKNRELVKVYASSLWERNKINILILYDKFQETKEGLEKEKSGFQNVLKVLEDYDYKYHIVEDISKSIKMVFDYELKTKDLSLQDQEVLFRVVLLAFLVKGIYETVEQAKKSEQEDMIFRMISNEILMFFVQIEALSKQIPKMTDKIKDKFKGFIKSLEGKEIKFKIEGKEHVIDLKKGIQEGVTEWVNSMVLVSIEKKQ